MHVKIGYKGGDFPRENWVIVLAKPKKIKSTFEVSVSQSVKS